MSQHGEDLEILKLFPAGYRGTALEIGAGDGVTLSNTLLLEKQGWHVICVEGDPFFAHELVANRKDVYLRPCMDQVRTVDFWSCELPGGANRERYGVVGRPTSNGWNSRMCNPSIFRLSATTLSDILDDAEITRLDLISLDVDGREAQVLYGLDLGRHPVDYMLVEETDRGSLETPVTRYMADHGYWLYIEALGGFNDIWVSERVRPKPAGYGATRDPMTAFIARYAT